MTNSQRSRLGLLRLVLLGALAVPVFAATGGLGAFQPPAAAAAPLVTAPPPILLLGLGLVLVLAVVGRQVVKHARG